MKVNKIVHQGQFILFLKLFKRLDRCKDIESLALIGQSGTKQELPSCYPVKKSWILKNKYVGEDN